MKKKADLEKYLDHIDPAALNYSDWVAVGMALKKEGYPASVWDSWSKNDPRYKAGECFTKWDGFNDEGFDSVTGGTIVHLAKEHGYDPGARYKEPVALTWSSYIEDEILDDVVVVDEGYIEAVDIEEPGEDWRGYEDTIKYLETLFDPDEYVGYVMDSNYDEDHDKYYPGSKGAYTLKAGQIIDNLKRYKDFGPAMGSYNPEAGAWIRFNPLNGQGVKNNDVTSYKYALIESDTMSMGEQVAFIQEMELPVACMVSSGGKSVHAIIKIEAYSYEEYKQKVNYLYQVCEKNGFYVDKQNRNPSRLSRLPGVTRKGKKQFLIATDMGKENFDEWKEWIEEVNDDMGEPELPPEDDKRPELADELIEGILREGHKMMIAGPSKAGKSFLLLQLGIAIATGSEWLGRPCKQGKVMYVNLELDGRSAWARVYDILEQKSLKYSDLGDNFLVWNLRGKSVPMDKLANKLIRRAEGEGYKTIIIDPIYKVLTGDENNARDMAVFTNQFDKVATQLGCAVIYCHHHSKGYQGQKRSMDRASGSGVFARDPDALLDMTQLEVDQADRERYGFKDNSATAWRIEGTLREFANFDPIDIYFNYPTHQVDGDGLLKDLLPEEEKAPWQKGSEKAKGKRQKKSEKDFNSFELHFANYTSLNNTDSMPLKIMAEYFEVQPRAIRNRIAGENYSDYYIKNSDIYHKNDI